MVITVEKRRKIVKRERERGGIVGKEKVGREDRRQRQKGCRKLVAVSHVEVDRQTGCPISLEITFFVLIRGASE